MSSAARPVHLITGKVSAWITLLVVLLLTGAVMALASSEGSSDAPSTLPDTSEAAEVSRLQQEFPEAASVPGVLVVTREGGGELGPEGLAAAAGAG
ncbi:MAG TPA: MMPL family transporter, partial [Actinomycetales bacterium]|nr:MMPL family transporter [Actinomycetales bacterium]